MSVKDHLHHTPAILRYDDELHPLVGNLLSLPPFVINGFHMARDIPSGFGLGRRLRDCRGVFAAPRRTAIMKTALTHLSSQVHTPFRPTMQDFRVVRHTLR